MKINTFREYSCCKRAETFECVRDVIERSLHTGINIYGFFFFINYLSSNLHYRYMSQKLFVHKSQRYVFKMINLASLFIHPLFIFLQYTVCRNWTFFRIK